MSKYIENLEEVVGATLVHSPTTFSWFGRGSPQIAPNVRIAIDPETARSYILYHLQATLYVDFYCQGSATRSRVEIGRYPLSGATPFVERLSAANMGIGQWADGWEALTLEGPQIVVTKNGVIVRASSADCLVPSDGQLASGLMASLRMPKELLAISPGYYMALGNNRLKGENAEPLLRFYWNILPSGAAALMPAITTSLNEAGYPFRFKVLNEPEHFTRCDAAVLYIRKSDYPPIASILERLYPTVAGELKPPTPALTKQLAPGLGFAEDPGGGESFGLARCRILAEGLLCAYESKASTPHARLEVVLDTFDAAGIRIEEPYLNPGSHDNYHFRPSSCSSGTPRNIRKKGSPVHHPSVQGTYLHTAVSIARHITREAIWHEGICNWLSSEIRPNTKTRQYELVHSALGPSLYSGTAGIALFMGELWSVNAEDEFRRTALGAIRHALSQVDMVMPAMRPGLYSGWAGVALVAGRLGRVLKDEELTTQARNLVARLICEASHDWEHDLLSGRAGAIVALQILSSYMEDRALLDYAVRLGDQLVSAADKGKHGYSWKSGFNKAGHNLTGLSHGTSGIAYALLELWRFTQEKQYLDAARMALEYERYWFDSEACNWPDFRLEPGDATERQTVGRGRRNWPFAVAWCNGAPGISMSRLRAYEILNDDDYRSQALAALETTRNFVQVALESASGNYSLCHGLSGNTEALLYGRRVLGSGWTDAERVSEISAHVADYGIKSYHENGRPWPCGLARDSTPNLMIGLAGTGYFYLRLHKPSLPSILLVCPEDWTTMPPIATPPGSLPTHS